MKFLVIGDFEDAPPIEGVVFEPYVLYDVRSFDSPEIGFGAIGQQEWYAEGRNHRQHPCWWTGRMGIARDFDDMGWFVEIEDLEHLMRVLASIETGEARVRPANQESEYPVIDLYRDDG